TRFSRDWSSDVCSSDLHWCTMIRNLVLIIIVSFSLSGCSTAQGYGYSTSDKKAMKYVRSAKECLAVSEKKLYPDYDCAVANYKKIGRASCRERGKLSAG